MPFFKLFPTQQYDFNRDGVLQNVIDIYRSVRPQSETLDNTSLYVKENIQNGERPDIMSERLYGTTDYYWTFFVINEFLHDGLGVWPMSQEHLQEYFQSEYNGYAITSKGGITVLDRNTDLAVTGYPDSLADRFEVGEIVYGSISGAKGTLTKKDLDMNQLIIQDVTNGTSGIDPATGNAKASIIGGGFIGGPADSPSTELIIGGTSGDSVSTHRAFKYRVAPHHYYSKTQLDVGGVEGKNRPITAAENIPGGESMNNVDYITNQAYIEELNFNRGSIKIIAPTMIEKFAEEFENLINE